MKNTNTTVIASLVFVAGVLIFVSLVSVGEPAVPLSCFKTPTEKKQTPAAARAGRERGKKEPEKKMIRSAEKKPVAKPSEKKEGYGELLERATEAAGGAYRMAVASLWALIKKGVPDRGFEDIQKKLADLPYGRYFKTATDYAESFVVQSYTFVRNLASVTFVIGKRILSLMRFDWPS